LPLHSQRPLHCTGNSARIFAESILNHLGAGRFLGFSAGSRPKGVIHQLALRVLQDAKLPTGGLRSKSWDEFALPGAPHFDFIFTVCDDAAGEVCPVWPGHPMTAHWGIADPAVAQGRSAPAGRFPSCVPELDNRIRVFEPAAQGARSHEAQDHLTIGSRSAAAVTA
jgi:arsenate reductase